MRVAGSKETVAFASARVPLGRPPLFVSIRIVISVAVAVAVLLCLREILSIVIEFAHTTNSCATLVLATTHPQSTDSSLGTT